MLPRRPGKEPLGGRDVPPSAQEKIDGAARFYPRRDRGRPSGLDAPLGHHLDQVTGAEFEGEIQSYAEHEDFPVKAPALKELLCRGGFRHRWPLAPQGQLFKFAPEPFRIYDVRYAGVLKLVSHAVQFSTHALERLVSLPSYDCEDGGRLLSAIARQLADRHLQRACSSLEKEPISCAGQSA